MAFTRSLILSLAFAAASFAAAQPVPSALSTLASKARIDGAIVSWCRGEFRSRRAGAYAVAVGTAIGGRYVILESDATVVELAPFTGGADLSCYTPAEARKLNQAIRDSVTIDGEITPSWRTTVVCGFVEDTRALCWQHSPAKGVFVQIGEWIT